MLVSRSFDIQTLSFYDFELRPLGTASIAQVHKAKLKTTGEIVAVKVQHEGLEAISYADLATLDFLAPVVSWVGLFILF